MKLKAITYTLLFYFTGIISVYAQMRGRADESEWRDPDDSSSSSWSSTLITLGILMGIFWLIGEIIKARDKMKK